MKAILLMTFFLFFSNAYAQNLKLTNYIKMQEALAADDFKTALDTHKALCAKDLTHEKKEYKDCAKNFKSMDELRTSFKTLSELYLKHGNKKEMESFQKASCPMAEARWVQKKGDLRNPYYGKSMLECGEKI